MEDKNSAIKLMKNFQSMLDLVSGFGHNEEIRKLYEAVDSMLQKEFQSLPLLVYSKNLTGKETKKCRLHWNKEAIKEKYDETEVLEILNLIDRQDSKFESWEIFKNEEEIFYGVRVGMQEKQFYFCLWKVNMTIPVEVMNYLARFIMNTHEVVKKWQAFEKAQDLIYKDDVTGLFNQRRLMKDLDTCIQNHKEFNQQFCVLFIDIDHFKSVNDGHGHIVGTQLLKDVGDVIFDTVRTTDYLYRYGGDEFVIILPDVGIDTGKVVGERILSNIKESEFKVSKTEKVKNMTVSIGIATFPEHAATREDILNIADTMMYEAKNTGRGKVSPADEVLAEKKQVK